MIKLFVGILLGVLMTGCSSPSSHEVTGEVRAAVSPSDVVVYRVPPENYTEIAIVSATSSHSSTANDRSKTDEVLELMKSEAARLGANGVLITNLHDETVDVSRVTTSDGNQSRAIKGTKFQKIGQGYAVFVE